MYRYGAFRTRTQSECLRPEPLSVRMVSVAGATKGSAALRCCNFGMSCLKLNRQLYQDVSSVSTVSAVSTVSTLYQLLCPVDKHVDTY